MEDEGSSNKMYLQCSGQAMSSLDWYGGGTAEFLFSGEKYILERICWRRSCSLSPSHPSTAQSRLTSQVKSSDCVPAYH